MLMKKQFLLGLLCLALVLPTTTAFANDGITPLQEDYLMSLVELYAPDTVKDWESALKERKALLKECKEAHKEAKKSWKKKKEEKRAEYQNQIEKFKSDELSKEEFVQYLEKQNKEMNNKPKHKHKHKEKEILEMKKYQESQHELYTKIKDAADQDDKKEVINALNLALKHFKAHNQKISAALK